MMVKPRSEEVSIDGGEDASKLVASNADPSLLVRVPNDNRINVDGVLDEKLKKVVAEWGQNSPPPAVNGSCGSPARNGAIGVGMVAPQACYVVALSSENGVVPHCDDGDVIQDVSKNPAVAYVSRPHVVGGSNGTGLVTPQSADDVQIAPQSGDDIAVYSGTSVVVHGDGGDKTNVVPVLRPCFVSGSISDGSHVSPLAGEGLVFKAGGSGIGVEGKHTSSTVRGPKYAGVVLQHARPVLSRGSGVRRGAGPVPNRINPPTPLPNRPEADVPGAVFVGPPEGAKVRPQFSEILKDNRIVGNGLKLQHYDPMENDDDVVLDASDEIPFVETWGYCLIGCFTGPFPGR
ncbi:hypothetical protein LIER_21168 [Lithospermum erythrorhizon]|uniref:Uncharacterized protein n=1 Tax=Lithospermum erythrorhizon TaxID=34254 RepID=A0AAV3QQE2_LITER